MSLAGLKSPVADRKDWDTWLFSHWSDTLEIVAAIQKLNHPMVVRTIDRVDPDDKTALDVWLQNEQDTHNDFNDFLGLEGVDLLGLDFRDKVGVEQWLYHEYQEHYAARRELGI